MQPFAAILLAAFAALPVDAASLHAMPGAELKLYYCYAPLAEELTILRGPVGKVGPVAERAGYPERFARQLVAQGLLKSLDAPVYCVMRETQVEIDRGRNDLVNFCPYDEDGTMSPLCGKKWTVRDVLPPRKP